MSATETTTLSLHDLDTFDREAPQPRGSERRYCCPLEACAGKPVDAEHRCLNVNMQSGAWNCKRCGATGKLREFWDEREPQPAKGRSRRTPTRVQFTGTVALPDEAPAAQVSPTSEPIHVPGAGDWRQHIRHLKPLAGTPGEAYLAGRGIRLDVATAAGVKFSTSFYGRSAVVLPLRDRDGRLVAAEGRYTDSGKLKAQSAGPKKGGTFATAGAWDADTLVIVEGPMDALSLATAGIPAVALCGCSLSDAAAWQCALRTVAVALDADDAGDKASASLLKLLEKRGSRAFRMRPELKDWNEDLQARGVEALRDELLRVLTPPNCAIAHFSAPAEATERDSSSPAAPRRPNTPPDLADADLGDVPSPGDEDVPVDEEGETCAIAQPLDFPIGKSNALADRPRGDLTITGFARSGRVIRLESPEFGRVALVPDGMDAPAGFVPYTATEMRRLFGMTPEALRLVHAVKLHVGGRLLDDNEMLPDAGPTEAP